TAIRLGGHIVGPRWPKWVALPGAPVPSVAGAGQPTREDWRQESDGENMLGRTRKRPLRAIAIDFLVALALIWAAALVLPLGHGPARAERRAEVGGAVVAAPVEAAGERLRHRAGLASARPLGAVLSAAERPGQLVVSHVLLSVAVAALIAFNL